MLTRQSCVAFERFEIVIIEHFVGDDGHPMLTAQLHYRLAFRRLDIRAGGIVGVDEYQRTDTSTMFTFQCLAELGDINVPGAVESLLVFNRIDAFETCDGFDERIARLRREHGIAGIA